MTQPETIIEKYLNKFDELVEKYYSDRPVTGIRSLFKSALEGVVRDTLEQAIDLITTHTEHNGRYCDTGGDMEWKCRSECVGMAVARLKSRLLSEGKENK